MATDDCTDRLWSTLASFLAYCVYYQRQMTEKTREFVRSRLVPGHVMNMYDSIKPEEVSLLSVVESFLKFWLMVVLSVWLKLQGVVSRFLHRNPNVSRALWIFGRELEAVDRRHRYLTPPVQHFLFSREED